MKICSSHRCAVTQHQRTATLFRTKMQSPLISAAQYDWLASGLYHRKHTYEDLLFTQVCSDPTPVHCITVQGKMQCPLITAAQQDRLAAGLYHCKHTCKDLLFSKGRSVTHHQCTATLFRTKMQSPLISAAQQDWLASGLYHYKHTYEDLLFTPVCNDPTPVHCITVQGKMQCPLIRAAQQD